MAVIRAEAASQIDAPAPVVYDILADYRDGHPSILPPAFRNLIVEAGGIGAGTIIRFDARLGGVSRTARAAVTEPQPGRVLVETDLARGAVTSFTVEPRNAGSCDVTIATEWTASGVRALVERLLAPPMLRKIYREELANLRQAALRRAVAK